MGRLVVLAPHRRTALLLPDGADLARAQSRGLDRRVQGTEEAITIVDFAIGLAMLAVLVAYSRAILADEGDRLPKSWIVRRLLAMAAFAVSALLLLGVASLATAGIAGMGHNPIVVENGRRVAHFGVPFRFATSSIDESPYSDSSAPLGTDAWWNPMETPTEFDETAFWRSTALIFALLSLFTLVPWALVADVKAPRRRA